MQNPTVYGFVSQLSAAESVVYETLETISNPGSPDQLACAEGTGGVLADPRVLALGDNGGLTPTMAIATDSPALDAAGTCADPSTDQRGVTRPQGAGCDVGAFELGQYSIGGTVSGLAGSGLVLQNNSGDDLAIAGDGTFAFSTALDDLSACSVTVKTEPSRQTCSVSSGTDVTVSCADRPSEVNSSIDADDTIAVTGNAAEVDGGAVPFATSPSDTDANGEARFVVSSSVAQAVAFKASFNPDLFITIGWTDDIASNGDGGGPLSPIPWSWSVCPLVAVRGLRSAPSSA